MTCISIKSRHFVGPNSFSSPCRRITLCVSQLATFSPARLIFPQLANFAQQYKRLIRPFTENWKERTKGSVQQKVSHTFVVSQSTERIRENFIFYQNSLLCESEFWMCWGFGFWMVFLFTTLCTPYDSGFSFGHLCHINLGVLCDWLVFLLFFFALLWSKKSFVTTSIALNLQK